MTQVGPKLSIVIPAYNVDRYIALAIQSALDQTLREIEVIVVDDGSTDRTPEIVSAFDDPRLRVVRQVNGGLSNARNTGVLHATAPYVGFLDGDDTWYPTKAARHVATMDADPSIGLTFSHSSFMDERGLHSGRILHAGPDEPSLTDMILRNRVGNGSSPVLRADCLRQAGPFDEGLRSCEDWEMWVRVLRDTPFKARLVPEVLTNYRVNTASLSMNFEGFLANADKAAARIERETPAVPRSVVRCGLASTYRIAATKALANGDRKTAISLVGKALRIHPPLPLKDPRMLPMIGMLAIPNALISALLRLAGKATARSPRSQS